MNTTTSQEMTAVAALLAAAYANVPSEVIQGPAGTATRNYLVQDTGGDHWFVKVYRRGTDLEAEQQALSLAEFAGQAGVPVAQVRRTTEGALIAATSGLALSVSAYIDNAETAEGGLRGARWPAVGTVVGRLHRALARHPAGPPQPVPAREACDVQRAHRRLKQLIAGYEARPPRTDFEQWALEAACERQAALPAVAALLEKLPERLTAQVVHGDLASPNLLLRGDQVAAVIDFRPPTPRSPVWELGRILLDPRTVLTARSWPTELATAVAGYRTAHPALLVEELGAVVRLAAGYLACSVYPLSEPLTDPGAVDASLEAYGHARHEATGVLWERLEEAEEVLRDELR